MTGLSVTIILQVSLLAAGGEDYAEAHRVLTETGKPMVVMVGADWCPACVAMKQTVIPQVRKRGLLRKVAFAIVNFDRNRKLATELTDGGPIPQLIMYRKTPDGWQREKLIGGQSAQTIAKFISQGVERDNEAKRARTASRQKETSATPKPHRSANTKPAGGTPQAG